MRQQQHEDNDDWSAKVPDKDKCFHSFIHHRCEVPGHESRVAGGMSHLTRLRGGSAKTSKNVWTNMGKDSPQSLSTSLGHANKCAVYAGVVLGKTQENHD